MLRGSPVGDRLALTTPVGAHERACPRARVVRLILRDMKTVMHLFSSSLHREQSVSRHLLTVLKIDFRLQN